MPAKKHQDDKSKAPARPKSDDTRVARSRLARDRLPAEIRDSYEVHEWRHASAILVQDFPSEWNDLVYVLRHFRLKRSQIETPGGGKSPIAASINGMFAHRGWQEKRFRTSVTVDGQSRDTPTHGVDYFKNSIGIEMEWNNKDPFYDRDLNNFRLLHELHVIGVGIIITRCDELQDIFDELGKGKSYGPSTTHMSKLLPRIEGRGAGGCPLLVFGITRKLYDDDRQ
jgi:hypothetical protein